MAQMTPTSPAAEAAPRFYRIGGIAAWAQLIITLILIGVTFVVGGKPANAAEYFAAYGDSKLIGLLRDDFSSVIIISLYLFTAPALYLALRRTAPVLAAYATLFTLIAITVTYATHSGFSLMHLSDAYAQAMDATQQSELLAAAEAVIASDIWNSTGGYAGGILLQGAGVLLALAMLRGDDFGRLTAYAGLLANGIDLLQHLLHPFTPGLSEIILWVAGPAYFLWFPLLGRDLLRLSRRAIAAAKATPAPA